MLIDIILYVVGSFVGLVSSAFALVTVTIPGEFTESVAYFVAHLNRLSGIVNFPDIFEAMAWFLTFTTYWYVIKLVLWVFALTPWFGKKMSPKA